jgi:hypothetical protein
MIHKKRRIEESEFNSFTAKEQFKWILENKDIVRLTLDNDCTYMDFKDDEDFGCRLKEWLGDDSGVITLLYVLGINAERC